MLFLCLREGPVTRGLSNPAWRVMSIAPAGSSRNSSSVHKIPGQATHPQLYEEFCARNGVGGGYRARAIRFHLCLSISLFPPSLFLFSLQCFATLCMTCEHWKAWSKTIFMHKCQFFFLRGVLPHSLLYKRCPSDFQCCLVANSGVKKYHMGSKRDVKVKALLKTSPFYTLLSFDKN